MMSYAYICYKYWFLLEVYEGNKVSNSFDFVTDKKGRLVDCNFIEQYTYDVW